MQSEELHKANEALLESEKRYSALFNARTNSIAHCQVVTNEKGKPVDYIVLKVNDAYEETTGIKKKDIEGRKITEVFPGIEHFGYDYIGNFGKVALEGSELNVEVFFEPLQQWLSIYVYSPKYGEFTAIFTGITERKHAEQERETTVMFLQIMNNSKGTVDLVYSATNFFRERSGFEAVGIRLKYVDDYPYFESRGFPEEFIRLENSLCARDASGQIIRDNNGYPIHECMCGNVICGRFDPSKTFFTKRGSFWTNSTTELLATTEDTDLQTRTRNRCNGVGYESVALIALRVGEECLGLLQLNDKRQGQFTPETISMWERLTDYLAVALTKTRAEDALHEAYEALQAQSEKLKIQSEEIQKQNEKLRTQSKEISKTSEVLRKSEEKYRTIIETTNEGIWVSDTKSKIIFSNKKMAEILGYSQDEMIGRLEMDFIDEENKAFSKLRMKKKLRRIDEIHEDKLVRKDGLFLWALVSSKALFDTNGKFSGALSMLTDITERKKAEEKIKSLANIVGSSNDAIITESLDGIITSWNKGAEQIYGYSAEEVIGKKIAILEPDNLKGEIEQLTNAIKQGKKIKHYETSRLKKDDTTINVSVTLSPIIDQYGKLVAISCIGGDITEKKIAEKLLQEKKIAEVSNRTKNEFLASISHELRTPLNSIIGFSDMLYEQAYGELNEKQLRVTGNISKSGKHLLKLINDILDVSKIEAGKMELDYTNFELAFELNMIRNILFPIADKKNIKIEIEIDSKLGFICADKDKFIQIMYNLVGNAIKFSYENSFVKIGARKKGDLVEITVKDTGIGIKVKDQYRLFKPFSQIDCFSFGKSQGTGLGLSLVKQIVHLHDGYVWFRSNLSEGSTFAFAIPINSNKGKDEHVELDSNV